VNKQSLKHDQQTAFLSYQLAAGAKEQVWFLFDILLTLMHEIK
jgi:hypothetical protein